MRSILAFALLIPAAAAAQQTPTPSVPARTELDFRELDVSGRLRGPAIARVAGKPEAGFQPLITLRGDFDAEMVRSVRSVR